MLSCLITWPFTAAVLLQYIYAVEPVQATLHVSLSVPVSSAVVSYHMTFHGSSTAVVDEVVPVQSPLSKRFCDV